MLRFVSPLLLVLLFTLSACKKKPDQPAFIADGGSSEQDVKEVIRTIRPAMEKCYDDAVAKKPDLSGKLMLIFSIGLDGKVDPKTAGLGGQAGDPVFAQCVLDLVVLQQFPKPRVITDVQMPVNLGKHRDAGAPSVSVSASASGSASK